MILRIHEVKNRAYVNTYSNVEGQIPSLNLSFRLFGDNEWLNSLSRFHLEKAVFSDEYYSLAAAIT